VGFTLRELFANDIGIDLGTANTLVYVRGKGIVVNEPSIVAVDRMSQKVLAIGNGAKEMLGRTPEEIMTIRPLKDGVIADFEKTEEMLRAFIRKVQNNRLFGRPRIVICVPSGITEVEKRAVRDSAESVVRSVMHMDDDYRSIMGRIMRLSGKSAWAEDPPSRLRRFVSNIQVFKTANADEFSVISYLLITRNRFDDDFFDLIPCERRDVVRRADSGFKLASREVIIDQALLGTPNLAIFL